MKHDYEEYMDTCAALWKAEKAFYDSLAEAGHDGAYWQLDMKVSLLSCDFVDVLETLTYSNKEGKLKKGGE